MQLEQDARFFFLYITAMITGMQGNRFLKGEDPHFIRNTAGITSVEFFWGMGMPVLIDSTFLQLFLRSLGASYFLIGLLPVFLGMSIPVFSILSAYVSGRLKSKRTSVMLYHMTAALPSALFGLYLFFFKPQEGILQLFLGMYFVFTIAIGFTLPAWQSYIVSLFSHEESMRALSVMYIVQSISKLIGSFVIYRIVARFALSVHGASMVFIFGGFILFFGALFFLITREEYDPAEVQLGIGGPGAFIRSLGRIAGSRDFRTLIGSDASYFAVVVALSFYGAYAAEYSAIPEELVAGAFVAVSYSGGIVSQVVFGWHNFGTLREKFVISKILGILGVLLLMPADSLWLFLVCAALLGASRSLRMLIYPPSVKNLARTRDTTAHFAMVSLLELPFSMGLPLIAGLFLDWSAGMQEGSYRILFAVLALLLAVGLFFSMKLRFSENSAPDSSFE